ncbi:UNVERIFIED_CONTAM: hypothetical protein FKN15_002393 [Acipenser sinensis]
MNTFGVQDLYNKDNLRLHAVLVLSGLAQRTYISLSQIQTALASGICACRDSSQPLGVQWEVYSYESMICYKNKVESACCHHRMALE